MSRKWVPFLKEEIDELFQLVKERVGDAFPDDLIYKLIDIVENATMVEIDFGDLLYCLEACKSGYKILESKEALDEYLSQHTGAIMYMLANKTYDVQDPHNSIEHFNNWVETTKDIVNEEGFLILSCGFSDTGSCEFYLISDN